MKKRIIRITIFVMLFFIVFSVKAANKTYTQSGVNSSYENYKSALTELKDLKCDGELYTQALVDKCNSIELQKSVSLTYLFNAKNSNKELIDSEIQKALDLNEENCKTAVSKDLQDMINKIYLMFFIAGPILLIFFGSLDATKAIVVGDEKTRKALYTKLVKRVIALLLLFASPALVGLLINLMGASKYSANIYTCSYTHKKITIKYTPVVKYNTGGSINAYGDSEAATRIIKSAEDVYNVAHEAKWQYTCRGGWSNLKNAYNNKTYIRLCCAEYVSFVLYKAGLFTESDITNMHVENKKNCGDHRGWTYATGVQSFLMKRGWIKITDKSELQPGDIIFSNPQTWGMPSGNCYPEGVRAGHVSIYVGDGYEVGAHGKSNGDPINPFKRKLGKMIVAYRAPK